MFRSRENDLKIKIEISGVVRLRKIRKRRGYPEMKG